MNKIEKPEAVKKIWIKKKNVGVENLQINFHCWPDENGNTKKSTQKKKGKP